MRLRAASNAFFAALLASALLAPAAIAASPPKTPVDPAVQMYVEQIPTKSGPVAADPSLRQKGAHVDSSSNAPIIIAVAVALVAAAFGRFGLKRLRAARERP